VNLDYDLINTYLWYAYLPPRAMPSWIDDCIKPENKGVNYSPEEAAGMLDQIFDELIEKFGQRRHLLPLSGGWDSRTILGALLQRLDSNNIETVTYGAPGQLDFDIGLKVAKWAGVKHYALDLSTVEFTWDKIIKAVKRTPWSLVPDCYFNQLAMDIITDDDKLIWSGFLNDAITGGHLKTVPIDSVSYRNTFINGEQRAISLALCDSNFDLGATIPEYQNNKLFLDDAFLFGLHCTNSTTPLNLPEMKWNQWSALIKNRNGNVLFLAPFIDERWAGYWFSAPREVRKGQKLFIKMLKIKFPELFSLPGKKPIIDSEDARLYFLLRKLWRGSIKRLQKKAPWMGIKSIRQLNYLDYDEMFRTRNDYKDTLAIAFEYLKENRVTPWLDMDKLWHRHMKKRNNYGDSFVVLIGLAANLTQNEHCFWDQ